MLSCHPNTRDESKEFIAHRWQSEGVGILFYLDTLHPRYSTLPGTLPPDTLPMDTLLAQDTLPWEPEIPYPSPERTWDQGPGWDLVQKMTSSHCEQKHISFLQLLLWVVKIKLPKIMSHCNTNFCICFQLALISTWNQCHGQRKCHIVQENLRPVIRTVYESL